MFIATIHLIPLLRLSVFPVVYFLAMTFLFNAHKFSSEFLRTKRNGTLNCRNVNQMASFISPQSTNIVILYKIGRCSVVFESSLQLRPHLLFCISTFVSFKIVSHVIKYRFDCEQYAFSICVNNHDQKNYFQCPWG